MSKLVCALGIVMILNSFSPVMAQGVCGNGVIDPGEECDDGNNDNGDGCSSTCKTLVSDDFNTNDVLSGIWTALNPRADGGSISVSGAGTQAAHLTISVPAGSNHEAWPADATGGRTNDSLRIMQDVDNSNFTVQVKLESSVDSSGSTNPYQSVGILVEEDELNWMRFDVHSGSDGQWYVFAAYFLPEDPVTPDPDPTEFFIQTNSAQAFGPSPDPLWLEVTRAGLHWTYRTGIDTEPDGLIEWTTRATFYYSINVNQVGVFAANVNSVEANAPALVAEFDYFFNAASPIVPEDVPCGDGVLDPGEDCDDGNNDNGDGCEEDCTLPPAVPGLTHWGLLALVGLLSLGLLVTLLFRQRSRAAP